MSIEFTKRWPQLAATAVHTAREDWSHAATLSERWLVLLLALADELQKNRDDWLQALHDLPTHPAQLTAFLKTLGESCGWFTALAGPPDTVKPWHAIAFKGFLLSMVWQWRRDDTPDLSKTMAALDRQLQWLEKIKGA